VWGDHSEADLVRRIYERLAVDGRSCRQVAAEFNLLGIPTKYQMDGRGVRRHRTQGIWRAGRIRNLVVNPVYRGEFQYGRRSTRPGGRSIITARVPRLVSDEVWYAAQEALARNRISAKNAKRQHLLRSVIRCGTCGLTYCGSYFGKASWYRCNGQLVERGPIEGRCPGKSIKCDFIEPIVWNDVERFLRNPGDLLADLEAEATDEAGGAITEADRITLAAALRDVELQRQRVLDLQVRGRMTDTEADAHLDRIAVDRAEIEKRIEALQPEEEELSPAVPPDILERLSQGIDGLTDEQKQEIVRLLVRIVIDTEVPDIGKKRATVRIEYRFPRVVATRKGKDSSLP
jgi:site-specific DNA recombinase